ncbi:PREDICTED: NUT family member 1 [Condylura cristata]|uniref:NUT family member 1 n=1 Tax=Condylura cristata TaxID=143302 RepID=UPI0003343E56|nr:PREDICTED: NUT family member 1 [Condylura cristata]
MASDGASPLPGPDMTMKAGTALPSFTALPLPPPAPGLPDPPPWEPPSQPPIPSAFSPGNPLVLSAFPSPLLVTGDGSPGPSGAEAGKVIIKVKTEVGPTESSQTQNFILTQTTLNWIASGAPCGGPPGPPPRFVTASNVKTLLPTKAIGVSQEGLLGLPPQVPPATAQMAPTVSPEKTWLGTTGEAGPEATQPKPSLGDLSHTSKGVYENFRRWQRYKALARRHLSQSPDAEALSCFLIPVLRSLARLKPTMTLEEGLPRAVQEWERTSNFDRMIFYEMAEKFMEFEAEEEMQIQNTQLMNRSQGLPPVAPLKLDHPGPSPAEAGQQPAYIPKKAASKARAPRRRQRKAQRPAVAEAPKEIPPEAVKEYADIMEGLVGTDSASGKSDGRQEEEERRQEEEGMYPDPDLLNYIDELCSQEVFVSKVEAVIHPQFLADLLSPEQQRDPLALIEELEQEEGLSLAQLVQKRLLALEEEDDAEAPPSCSGVQSDSSPSVSDEEEDGGGRLRPSPGSRGAGGTVRLGKSASPGNRAREVHGGQGRALDGLRGMHRDGNALLSFSSWDPQVELEVPQGTQGPLAMSRGSGKVICQASTQQVEHLGGSRSRERSLVAERSSKSLSLCWQEGPPQLEIVPPLDVGLTELASPQGQGLEKQVLMLQSEQLEGLERPPQGKKPIEAPQEGSSGPMWGEDRGPPMVQSYDQSPSAGAAEAQVRDGASLSPGFWLRGGMDATGLELPLQIEEVIDNFHDRVCVAEHQGGCPALGSRRNISLGPGETTTPEDEVDSAVPYGGTDAIVTLEKRNYCSLPGPLRSNSPAVKPKDSKESPETTEKPSVLWAEGCSSLLESRIDASTLGASKETLQPTCQGNILILGTQDVSAFLEPSQDGGIGNNLIPSQLESTEHINTLDVRDAGGLQLGEEEASCPSFNSYELQREGKEDTDSSQPKDPTFTLGNRKSYALRTPKSTSHQSLGRSSPRWGAEGALVPGETSPVNETRSSAGGAKGEEEEEDEELSNFAYLLASKLSLSPRGFPLSPHPTSGLPSAVQGVQRAPRSLSAEARGLGHPPYPVAKSGKRGLVEGASAAAEKRPYPGAEFLVSGEKPLTLGVGRSSQPRKRRRDSFVTGRRKKRRRSQ